MKRHIRIVDINDSGCERDDQPVDCRLDENEGNPYFTYDYFYGYGKIKTYIEKSEFEDIWKKLMSLDYPKILEENSDNWGYDGGEKGLFAGSFLNEIGVQLWCPYMERFKESNKTESIKFIAILKDLENLAAKYDFVLNPTVREYKEIICKYNSNEAGG